MCGVFGYVGKSRDLSSFIVENLQKLEYRGYDSAGIAIYEKNKFYISKETGELSELKKIIKKPVESEIGIGHTRWATHGGVTKQNAHPHMDCTGRIVVVHNGIIENFEELKNGLLQRKHKYISETDTEVVAHLVEEKLSKKIGITEAVRLTFNELKGLNAIVVLTEEQKMVAFRRGSPLVAGISDSAIYLTSDTPALSALTSKIIFIEDNMGVQVSKEGIKMIDGKSGKMTSVKPVEISMGETKYDKGNYAHFMLKEIFEEPEVIARIANYDREAIQKSAENINQAYGVFFTACGTASYAGMAAVYMFSEIAKKHVNFAVASEFPYFQHFLKKDSLLIAASQSGETMDTLVAVTNAQKYKSKVCALVNVPGSTLARKADTTLLLKAGVEQAVVSTKAYIAKLSLFFLLAYSVSGKYSEGVNILQKTAKEGGKFLRSNETSNIKKLARQLSDKEHIYLIGRGINYPTAMEGALKIKEASYIHAEGLAGGELKHGPLALISKGTPCIVITANDSARAEILSNAQELSARGAYIIGISPSNEQVFDKWISVPDSICSPIISVLPLQLLGYYLALAKKVNPDRPRNLAKSVTVK